MSTAEETHKWYVVRAITGQEKKVKHNIEVELERDNKTNFVPEILIPTEKIYQVKDGKKVIKERNAFPGYILINADFSDPEVMPLIKSVSGVVGFLGSKDTPVPLRQSELSRILGTADELTVWNSILLVIFAVSISVALGAVNGYVLSKWRFQGDTIIFGMLLFGCFIPFQIVLIPMARVLGLLDLAGTLGGLVLVHVCYGIPFTTLFFRNFYVTVPMS